MKEDKRWGTLNQGLDEEYIDTFGSFKLLNTGILLYESKRIMLAAQELELATRGTLIILDRSNEWD